MRGSKHLLAATFCFAAALSWVAASAQEVPQRRATATPPPAAAKTSKPIMENVEPMLIELSLNKAKAVTLPRPVGKIVIGNEAVADVHFDPAQPTKIYVVSKAIGSTNVFFIDKSGDTIEQAEVRVLFDNDGIKAALQRLMPDENVDVSVFRDSVFLTGKVRSASAAKNAANIARRFVAADANVTNMLTVIGGQQVILQVRVAEMDRDVRKNLAVEGTFQKVNIGGRGLQFATSAPTATITAFATGRLFTGTNIFGDPTFKALERQNLTKTLAEPTLTAISGETASFLSGGEFPFPSGLDENGQTIFEFREFGVGLNFTPTVVDENRISMQISMEISAIDTANSLTITNNNTTTTVPGLSVKRTETTIDLPSGGTLMISGLLKDNLADTISGFPYLKDVPILG
ncbi:MAG: pilus assembly protein N-terminal domain-containing protein, partial [Rhodospirillales bacterium]|nr:pilus assembly protein N-terminal domain-containing protein [Rhodospirillales bacterium]